MCVRISCTGGRTEAPGQVSHYFWRPLYLLTRSNLIRYPLTRTAKLQHGPATVVVESRLHLLSVLRELVWLTIGYPVYERIRFISPVARLTDFHRCGQ